MQHQDAIDALIADIKSSLDDNGGCGAHLDLIIAKIRAFVEGQRRHITRLNSIGVALSSEHNLDKLLEMILEQAREFTRADGGTLYLMSDDETHLHFTVVQTDSLGIRMGGTQGAITWPPLSLYVEGRPNRDMVAALCALKGNPINIEDVYDVQGFNFEGTKRFDAGTGYRSRSMLVIPMRHYDGQIIGVLQLINRQNSIGETVSFSLEDQETTMSLASQAAVTLTNARLVHDLEELLDSFIRMVAIAIDEKSPYTGGHVRRVAELAMMLTDAVNTDEGRYKEIRYTDEEMRQIYFAAWMHDVGKITTPEYIIDKSTKLETIHDRIHTLDARFEILKRDALIHYLETGRNDPAAKEAYEAQCTLLENEAAFVRACNIGGEFMSDDKIARLTAIAARRVTINGIESPLINEDELANLSIRKGTLTEAERQKINDHAMMSYKMLTSLPFPKKLHRVPEIAAAHHEKLNGKGYPLGLKAEQITLEGRILAIADIFEALTAADRPYKKAKTLAESRKIIDFMLKNQEIDPDLLTLFYEKGLDLVYARKELKPEQYEENNEA